MGCYFLLQGIFPTKGSNPRLLYCRQILSCLSHQEVTVLFKQDAATVVSWVKDTQALCYFLQLRVHLFLPQRFCFFFLIDVTLKCLESYNLLKLLGTSEEVVPSLSSLSAPTQNIVIQTTCFSWCPNERPWGLEARTKSSAKKTIIRICGQTYGAQGIKSLHLPPSQNLHVPQSLKRWNKTDIYICPESRSYKAHLMFKMLTRLRWLLSLI